MTIPLVLLAVVCGTALIALAAFANWKRIRASSRHAAYGSDGYVPWVGGDSSSSDCGAGDSGGCDGGGGGGD